MARTGGASTALAGAADFLAGAFFAAVFADAVAGAFDALLLPAAELPATLRPDLGDLAAALRGLSFFAAVFFAAAFFGPDVLAAPFAAPALFLATVVPPAFLAPVLVAAFFAAGARVAALTTSAAALPASDTRLPARLAIAPTARTVRPSARFAVEATASSLLTALSVPVVLVPRFLAAAFPVAAFFAGVAAARGATRFLAVAEASVEDDLAEALRAVFFVAVVERLTAIVYS